MTFELFGAGCFGTVIGFVAWHVFREGGPFGVKQLGAFIAALLGAVVMTAFPAGTTLFAAYSSGLALGFFLVPASRLVSSATAIPETYTPDCGDFPTQLTYVSEHWPEVERVVTSALDQHKGTIHDYNLMSLPLDKSGRIAVLQRYARTHPERTSVRPAFLGWKLFDGSSGQERKSEAVVTKAPLS